MGKKIKGVALAPGVSRNGRLYTRENIAKAYGTLKARLAEGLNPVVMRTHHDAGDDSLRIVARVTDVSLTNDGALAYEAVPADTQAGRDITALMEGKDAALAHVSVFGQWVGKTRMVQHEGRFVETADALEIDKIDFTATPGVLAATASLGETYPEGVIAESMRPVQFVDESPVSEALSDQDMVDISLMGSTNRINVALTAWCVPATQMDAYADTIQRALAAALNIASGGPVDDDEDTEALVTGEGDQMETHEATDTDQVTETRKESDMTDTTEAVTETVDKPAEGNLAETIQSAVAAGVVEALKAAGVVKETEAAAEVEEPVEEKAPAVDVEALKESLKKDLLAELVTERAVTPTRKGYRVTENVDEQPADWNSRGDDFAKAFGLIPEDGSGDAA